VVEAAWHVLSLCSEVAFTAVASTNLQLLAVATTLRSSFPAAPYAIDPACNGGQL
jgi:hypothetical protein